MTKDELTTKIKELDRQHKVALNRVYKEYALSNNKVELGDVVVDGNITIKVEKLGFYKKSSGESAMRYHGPRLKKDGTSYKSGECCNVYQR